MLNKEIEGLWIESLNLLKKRDACSLRTLLSNASHNSKGELFELVLNEIFEGNGWNSVKNGKSNDKGADIILYPSKSNSPVFVVQAKNHAKPLTVDQVRLEIAKFEQEGSSKYNCNQFRIISMNGYVKGARDLLGNFKVTLETWEDIVPLILNYKAGGRALPPIELNAHNQWAWEKSQDFIRSKKSFAFIQATGTGKSYLGLRTIFEFYQENIIYMAPTSDLFNQLESTMPWLREHYETMTYAQASYMKKSSKSLSRGLKLIILDEFHRLGAEKWGEAVLELIQANPNAIVIGLSATPVRFLDDQRDMVKELFDGRAVYGPDLFEAIVRGILTAPEYVTGFYKLNDDISDARNKVLSSTLLKDSEKIALLNRIELSQKSWEENYSPEVLISKRLESLNGKHMVFCEDISHINEMADEVSSWFRKASVNKGLKDPSIKIHISHSEMSDMENKKSLNSFLSSSNEQISIMFSVNKFNEGLHVKDTLSVFLLRKTMSPIIYYQQIGRCLSADQAHKPVIFDFVNNQKAINKKPMRLALEKAAKRESERRSLAGLNPQISVSWDIEDAGQEWIETLEEMSYSTSSWSFFYQRLCDYNDIHGHCFVPLRSGRLGKWIARQRYEYKQNILSEDRISLMNELNFSWDPIDEAWNDNFFYINSLSQVQGLCPYKSGNKEIDEWMNTQRKFKREGRLRKDREIKLNSIGFVWSYIEQKWNERYHELKTYYYENGHSNVPRTHGSLGRWVAKQREDQLKISKNRKDLLDCLNFRWRNH